MTESNFVLISWLVTGIFFIGFVILFVCLWAIYYKVIDIFKLESDDEF